MLLFGKRKEPTRPPRSTDMPKTAEVVSEYFAKFVETSGSYHCKYTSYRDKYKHSLDRLLEIEDLIVQIPSPKIFRTFDFYIDNIFIGSIDQYGYSNSWLVKSEKLDEHISSLLMKIMKESNFSLVLSKEELAEKRKQADQLLEKQRALELEEKRNRLQHVVTKYDGIIT